MRASFVVSLLAAGCASPGTPQRPGETPDRTVTANCKATLAEYCTTASCDQTLEAAQQDEALCAGSPSMLVTCGGYQVVLRGDLNTAPQIFYSNGNLVAIVNRVDVIPGECAAGPLVFLAPQCPRSERVPLDACVN